jgi:hypothetical protein
VAGDKSILHRYSLIHRPDPNSPWRSWAEAVIGADGFFAVVSDYGSWAHGWWHHGEKDARMFWLSMPREVDYFCSKIVKRDHFNTDGTIQFIKEQIIDRRRYGGFTAEEAREEWDWADDISDEESFNSWMCHTSFDAPYEFAKMEYPPDIREFASIFLPLLADAVRVELEAEGLIPCPAAT